MTIQQDQVKMNQSTSSDEREASEGQIEEAPKLEFSSSSHESLETFGAAIGGAVLGVLATLLILAIINNGTLRFNTGNMEELQANLARVDENVGAVNHNVEVVAQRLEELAGESGAVRQIEGSLADLDSNLAEQEMQLGELDVTRRNFDTFTTALAQALNEMGTIELPAADAPASEGSADAEVAPVQAEAAEVAPTTEEAAPAEEAATDATIAETAAADATTESAAEIVLPTVLADAAVPTDAVMATLFVDSNGDGVLGEGEVSLVGAIITLTAPDGETMSAETTDTGVLFEALPPGEYTLSVDDALGFALTGEASVLVTVAEESDSGQMVLFGAAEE